MGENGRYDDILRLPHPHSKEHLPMTMANRAAQFAPFAALSGHDAVLRETARCTQTWREPSEERKAEIDAVLRAVAVQECSPRVTVTFFVPDVCKEGGAYVTVSEEIRKVDVYERLVKLEDGTEIPIDRICDMEVSHRHDVDAM